MTPGTARRRFHLPAILSLLAALTAGALGGCSTNPATGRTSFTGLSSTEDETQAGEQMHPQAVRQFGGEYGSEAFRNYIASIGRLLAQTVERRDLSYTFTVLNSDTVNAFALPGGYIYVTRGLIALAGDEAELAAVLAHELGHVTALHHARAAGQSLLTNILVAGLGLALGGDVAQGGQMLGAAALQSFSREHEREADRLGIRYLSRAGYDPQAMSRFLTRLRAHAQLEAILQGASPESVDRFNWLASHPAPIERVSETRAIAAEVSVPQPMHARDIYLRQIDGMLYGDDPAQGVVRGRSFIHPRLGFRFEVPAGFSLLNGPSAVTAAGPGNARILFDQARQPTAGPVGRYVRDVWAKGVALSQLEPVTVNGMEGATAAFRARTSEGVRDIRLVAIRVDPRTIYRFMFVTAPDTTARLAPELQRTTYSFRRLAPAEAAAVKPLRLEIVPVRPGDTVADLATRMAYPDHQEARFRVLNGLEAGEAVRPGQSVKLVRQSS